MAAYSLGGRTYPMVTVSQCHTCQSPMRLDIEKMILTGTPYLRISRWTEETLPEGQHLSANSVRHHFDRGHMPVEAEVVRQVLDRKATERGEDLERVVAPIVDGVGFAEIVLQKSVQRMANGEIEPSVADGLNAARIMEQFREFEAANSEEVWVQAFIVYHELAQRIMTPSQFEQFGRELAASPVLRSLTEAHATEEPETETSSFYDVSASIPGSVETETEGD